MEESDEEEQPDAEIQVPEHKVKLVVGPGGEKIKHIQRKSKCRLQVRLRVTLFYSHEEFIFLICELLWIPGRWWTLRRRWHGHEDEALGKVVGSSVDLWRRLRRAKRS